MEAKDLMIGDLVRVNRDVCIKNDTIVRVCGIDATNRLVEKGLEGSATCVPVDDIDFYSGGIWVKYLSPILLTSEILEKNGFDINGIPEDMVPVEDRDWSDDTYVWSKPETPYESMKVCVYMDDPYNFFIGIICQYCHVDGIHVKFVHELQHALRLCGIDKEIVI